MVFTQEDLDDLAARGIDAEEIERQLALFRNPPPPARLERGCSLGDGIERLDEASANSRTFEQARASGRLTKFVPASGAASRMFQALLAQRGEECGVGELERRAAQGDGAALVVAAFLCGAERLPFAAALRAEMARRGDDLPAALASGRLAAVIDAAVGDSGLGLATLPKGLIPFHAYGAAARTAFEEHLWEAADLVADADGVVRVHFTVAKEHVSLFEAALLDARTRLESDRGVRLQVEFSTQSPRTDTVAADLDNRLLRDARGHIVFRPGGHGALLDNLGACGADIALIQNIDNIQPQHRRAASLKWKRLLIGRLVQLEQRRNELCASADADGLRAYCEVVGLEHEHIADADLPAHCDRPLRVCGVVRNTGEPGGGPFWVRDDCGTLSRQIIESAQVDPESAEQQAIFSRATHFNPVLLACGLRDYRGRPYDLKRWVDERAVFLARKSVGGVAVKALERPGLWNGSMAGWATVFAEIGEEAFTPVKTVADLLRPEHSGEA